MIELMFDLVHVDVYSGNTCYGIRFILCYVGCDVGVGKIEIYICLWILFEGLR